MKPRAPLSGHPRSTPASRTPLQCRPGHLSPAPRNFALVIWDNEVHQTTGGQATATAARSSLAAIARGAGIEKALEVRTEDELGRAYDLALRGDGPVVACVKVEKGRAEGRFDRDVLGHARRFMQALAALPAG